MLYVCLSAYAGDCENGKLINQTSRERNNHCGTCNSGYILEGTACLGAHTRHTDAQPPRTITIFAVEDGVASTSIFDKRDEFDFEIANLPNLSGHILDTPE